MRTDPPISNSLHSSLRLIDELNGLAAYHANAKQSGIDLLSALFIFAWNYLGNTRCETEFKSCGRAGKV